MTQPFRIIAADNPCKFKYQLPGPTRGAEKNYKVMTVEQICRFHLPPIADDAWLLLWRVGTMKAEAVSVMQAWGFEDTGAELVWVKTTGPGESIVDPLAIVAGAPRPGHGEALLAFGMGRTTRNCHEVCMIGRRGKPQVASRSVRSVFFAPAGRHSEKPDRFFRLVEQLCGEGPRAELFARQRRVGWTGFGDELPAEES